MPVHALIEAQVDRTPGAVALIDGARRFTFAELDAWANHAAAALRARGVGPEVRVGVALPRSAEMIVAVLAVMKAGGAYVPIDPDHPRERRDFIARDAELAIVLDHVAPGAAPRAPIPLDDDAAMYVLYTSGSTGTPKGVVTPHAAIVNRLRWGDDTFPFAAGEVACARTTLGFVDSVAEIFAPLAAGVPLVVVGGDARTDLDAMLDLLARERVTRIVLVPSQLTTLLELHPDVAARVPSLRWWFLGGEPVPVALVAAFVRLLPGRKLINLYGATELSGDATAFDFDHMPGGLGNAPIGRAIRGSRARVVDDSLREVAPGDTGEVVVSGACLARGYHDRPDLTAARFLWHDGERLYRTGDLGRVLPTGDIEYLGRLDQQVKIRGMRVELGEVEARLGEVAGVAQVAAVAQDDGAGRRTLVAFYTGDAPATALREHLRARVPGYMVPSAFVAMDALPANPSGKLDRRALATLSVRLPDGELPATDDERHIARIWETVLGLAPIARTADFHDLGGHSLAAVRIVSMLRDSLGLALPIRTVLDHPTIASLAAACRYVAPHVPRTACATYRMCHVPAELGLSWHQVPFWAFRAVSGDASVVAEVFGFVGAIEVERLQRAFGQAVAAFDGLWMEMPRWKAVQRIQPRRVVRFEVRDRRGEARRAEEVLQEEADANSTRAFDGTPLVHARLVWLPGGEARLVVAVPHIVADMSAMERFRDAMERAYVGAEIEPEAAGIADVIAAEAEEHGAEIEEDAAYWRGVGEGPAWIELPARLFATGRARAFSSRALPADLIEGLARFGRGRAVTGPGVLIGGILDAIGELAGVEDASMLLMVERRDREELRGTFASLASLMRVRRGASVEETAAQLLRSYEHARFLMERPTFFNDFWADAPRVARAAVRAIAGRFAGYVFALVPRRWPRHHVVVAVNLMPEVYEPARGAVIVRRRGVEQMLRPDDIITGADAFLTRTLQIHLARDDRDRVTVNLYGGGIHQAGLDELNDRIAAALLLLSAS